MRKTLVLILILLASCTRGDYWAHTNPPGLVMGVAELPDLAQVCRRVALGCYDRTSGYIWLQAGMDPVLKLCVIRHEYRHAAGDMHPAFDDETPLNYDCGDGTILSGWRVG